MFTTTFPGGDQAATPGLVADCVPYQPPVTLYVCTRVYFCAVVETVRWTLVVSVSPVVHWVASESELVLVPSV
jgi:hypothetical protein